MSKKLSLLAILAVLSYGTQAGAQAPTPAPTPLPYGAPIGLDDAKKSAAALLAISQIGGPLLILIWGGAAWWLFAHDHQLWGAFMIVWGLFVGMVDNFIKPWLIGLGVEMPMSLTILGVFNGFLAFGFLGLFIGPTLIAILFTLVQAWRSAVSAQPAADVMKPAA
jgi:predicted PurR-regulated permease PerM